MSDDPTDPTRPDDADPSPSDAASEPSPETQSASEAPTDEAEAAREEAADETPEPVDLLQPLFRESPLRPEGGEAPPMWLWMVIFGVMLFSVFYLGNYIGDFSPDPWLQSPDPVAQATTAAPDEETVSGASVYSARCANCHQGNGEGVPNAFPPLNGTRWVEDKGQIIRILLHGMQGPVDVRGSTYNGNMPAWGSVLSDKEIAAVITHVRQNWENDFPDVTAEEVAAVRGATDGRAEPWSATELDEDANQVVPSSGDEPTASTEPSIGQELYARFAAASLDARANRP